MADKQMITTALAEADDPAMLPGPGEPMAVAREVTGDRYTTGAGDLTLRHWRGGWWRWRTSCWVEEEHRAVRAELYQITEHAQWIKVDSKMRVTQENWDPNRHKIADVAEALAAVLHLPESTGQPGWIGRTNIPDGVIVACRNGLLHVETRQLYPHTPRYFNQTSVGLDYEADAPEPKRWRAFLDDLWPDDDDSVAALQEYFGYVISGRLDLQKMLLLVGPTRGGKGTITRVLGALVGKDNVAGPTMSSLGSDFGLAPLIGKPLAVISDARLNGTNSHVVVERLLSISGEDVLTVNIKYREQWNGKLPSRFVVLSNELPHFGDASSAIIGRFVVLMLTRSWLGNEDLDLEPDLNTELSGILNWCLDGLARLTETGRFTRPGYTDELALSLANLASPVGAFVRDRCERDPLEPGMLSVKCDALFKAWRSWAEDNGQKPGTAQTFGRNLRAVVPTLRVTQPGGGDNRDRWYVGVALRTAPVTYTYIGNERVRSRACPSRGGPARERTRANPLLAPLAMVPNAITACGRSLRRHSVHVRLALDELHTTKSPTKGDTGEDATACAAVPRDSASTCPRASTRLHVAGKRRRQTLDDGSGREREDVLPGTRLPWADWSEERYKQSDSYVPGWPPDERDMILYWEAGDAHEVRLDLLADGIFAHQVKSCQWGRYCGTVDVPAARLWVAKIRHDRDPKGMLYTLCRQHVVEFRSGDRDEYANDPQVPTCPIHFRRMLGGVCDLCD